MMMNWTRFVALSLLGLTLSGCKGPGILTSLDDLTAHVDRQGLLDLQQQRVLSLSGLIPTSTPGDIYRYHGDRSPFTAFGMSTVREAGCAKGETRTYYEERTIDYDGGLQKLTGIRDQLIGVRERAAKLIRLRLDRLGAQASKDTSRLAALDTQVARAEDEFQRAIADAHRLLDLEGLMVVRAETTESNSLGARLSSILSVGSQSSEENSGFAVLAGLRTSRLFLGSDLKPALKVVPNDWTLIGRKFPYVIGGTWLWDCIPILYPGQLSEDNYYIPTSRLQAKYVLYAQDSVSAARIQADLKGTLEQLGQLESLSKAEEIEIEMILSSVASLGSSGILGPCQLKRVYWGEDRAAESEEWHTVYAVFSEFDDLDNLLSKNPLSRMHLMGFL